MERQRIADALAGLRDIVGDAHVLTAAADTAPYFTDWRGRYIGDALCVAAGWLRLPPWRSALMMSLGKGARYVALAALLA